MIANHQGNVRVSFEESNGVAVVHQENSYYPFGLIMPGGSTPTAPNLNLYNEGSEWQNDFSDMPDLYTTYYRNYDPALARFIAVDPLAEQTENLSVYQYANNNPINFNDPLGDKARLSMATIILASQLFDKTNAGTDALWTPGGGGGSSSDPQVWNSPGYPSFNWSDYWAKFTKAYTYFDKDYGMMGVEIVAIKNNKDSDNEDSKNPGARSIYYDYITGVYKHFNGNVGALGLAVQGYNSIGNDIKRRYAYRLSKLSNVRSGVIFQKAQSVARGAGKVASKLGSLGTGLSVGVIVYEGLTDTWDAHTIVNIGLLGVARRLQVRSVHQLL